MATLATSFRGKLLKAKTKFNTNFYANIFQKLLEILYCFKNLVCNKFKKYL